MYMLTHTDNNNIWFNNYYIYFNCPINCPEYSINIYYAYFSINLFHCLLFVKYIFSNYSLRLTDSIIYLFFINIIHYSF